MRSGFSPQPICSIVPRKNTQPEVKHCNPCPSHTRKNRRSSRKIFARQSNKPPRSITCTERTRTTRHLPRHSHRLLVDPLAIEHLLQISRARATDRILVEYD